MTAPRIPDRIETDRLVLRPVREADAEALIEAIAESRAELTPWMAWAPHQRTVDDAREFGRRVERAWREDDGEEYALGIFRRGDGRFLGGTGYHRIQWHVPSAEIGYWMRTSAVGTGYVREAVTALVRVGFGEIGLKRLVITCAATNVRSRRVAEAVGFRHEATLRNHDRLPDGALRDTLVFALIDTDETLREMMAGKIP